VKLPYYLSCLLVSLLLVSCASNSSNRSSGSASVSAVEASLERQVVKLVNSERAKKGLKTLTYHKGLSNIGRRHSSFMMENKGSFNLLDTNITHQGYTSRRNQAQLLYNFESVAENVIYTSVKSNLARHIVDSWLESSSHRMILFSKTASVGGIGIRNNDGEIFGTMILAEKSINNIPAFVGPQDFR